MPQLLIEVFLRDNYKTQNVIDKFGAVCNKIAKC